MNQNVGRNILIYTIIALVLIALFNQFQSAGSRSNVEVLKYSAFKQEVRNGNIQDAVIRATSISGHYRNSDGRFVTSKGPELEPELFIV